MQKNRTQKYKHKLNYFNNKNNFKIYKMTLIKKSDNMKYKYRK